MIYLDNCATTAPYGEVTELIKKEADGGWYNPSATYAPAIAASKRLAEARKTVARAMGAAEKEIYFTASGTEADNIAVFGGNKNKKGVLICSAYEHPAVYECFTALKNQGQTVHFLPLQADGRVDGEALLSLLTPAVSLVSVMHVNNEMGAVNDIAALCRLVKSKAPNALFHADGVQALGKVPVNVHAMGVDLYSVSSHKIHGGRGVGALYVKNGVHLKPHLVGGGQEMGLRPGTENLPAIMGFALACQRIDLAAMQRVSELKKRFFHAVSGGLSDIMLYGNIEEAAPHVLSFGVKGVKAEILQQVLSAEGVYIGRGSACSSRAKTSRTALALRIPGEYAEGTVRISFSVMNTEEEVDKASALFTEKVKLLRRM